ncbi:MAG: phosphoenolpyruvate carboxylase [Kofleriaceae bacterium]
MHPTAALLDADLARLAAALSTAAGELSGGRTLELIEGLRDQAIAQRTTPTAAGQAALTARLRELDLDDLEDVGRVFTHWCHLMNTAEEQQRIRVLRSRDDAPDGVLPAVRAMRDAGMTADDVAALFERALVMPVLTAHPTEARRRSVLDHLSEVAGLLDLLERPLGGPAQRDATLDVIAEVLALLGTEESRTRKPTPADELEAALEVFRRTLFEVTADVYDDLEDALATVYPERSWRVPTFFRWGTWVGGDRDGNPNVRAHITRAVFERQRTVILDRYLEDVAALGRSLSVSARRGLDPAGVAELEASLVRDRTRMPEVAARAQDRARFEPWREKLWYMAARLRATRDRTDGSYVDVGAYRRDLALLERALDQAGFGRLARGLVRRCQRRAEVFGFHLATVDIRQHSAVHERVVDELLVAHGRPGYLALDEAGRVLLLGEVLARPMAPTTERTGLSDAAQDLLGTLDMVGRACRELGRRACERYVVSFTSQLSDLLEVVFLTRAAGLAPGEVRPVPLLEQLEDLGHAGQLAQAMLANPVIRGEIGDDLEVMVGYSDSGKQVGYVASAVALQRAQLELASVAQAAGVLLTVFHGRGGAIGRGGGPASDAIRAQPVAALRGRIRVTEQGETVTARYARPEIAHRDLELTLGAILRSAADLHRGAALDADPVLDAAAATSLTAYQRLTSDRDRLARYTLSATPIRQVGNLPLGSRPASRKAGFSLDDLRAIPWVFSWNQSRHGLPGWFGLGSALEGLAAVVGADQVPALVRASRFFRALVRNGELAMIRADIDVAREYAALADPADATLFALIEEEYHRTRRALAELAGVDLSLADRPYLAESVRRRNPYIDILSHAQIELLRRIRTAEAAGDAADVVERLRAAIFTTISGIAAGLQTAG